MARLKQELALAEEQVSENAELLNRHRNASRDTVGRLEEHEAEMRHKQRSIERLESQVLDLEGKVGHLQIPPPLSNAAHGVQARNLLMNLAGGI